MMIETIENKFAYLCHFKCELIACFVTAVFWTPIKLCDCFSDLPFFFFVVTESETEVDVGGQFAYNEMEVLLLLS